MPAVDQCKVILLLVSVFGLTKCEEFDAKKHVHYEMYCRCSNQSQITTVYDIDMNILKYDNFIVKNAKNVDEDDDDDKDDDEDDDDDNEMVIGVQNCNWNWDPNRRTRIFIHGFYSDREILEKYARGYLERDDYNFIAINWLRGARTINYVKARHRIHDVGRTVAKFIDYLVKIGLNLNEFVCVGHSLGAHTCGIVGKHLNSGKMSAIMALDPALPLFHLKDESCRLHYEGKTHLYNKI